MDACIIKHLEDIHKNQETKPAMETPRRDAVPQPVQQEPKVSEVANELKPKILPELEETLKNAQRDLAPFIQQLHIDRIQLSEAKEKQEKVKLDKILRYTRLVFLPHGFTDEELFQIEETVKLLVQYNGIVNCVSVKIEKKKLKQTDLKNFAWNIGHQYNIDSESAGYVCSQSLPCLVQEHREGYYTKDAA